MMPTPSYRPSHLSILSAHGLSLDDFSCPIILCLCLEAHDVCVPPPPLLLSPVLPLASCVLLLPLHSSSSCLSPVCFFLLLQDSSDPLYDCTLSSPSPSPHIGEIQSPFECPQLLEHGFWWDRMCFEYTGLALCLSVAAALSPFPHSCGFPENHQVQRVDWYPSIFSLFLHPPHVFPKAVPGSNLACFQGGQTGGVG